MTKKKRKTITIKIPIDTLKKIWTKIGTLFSKKIISVSLGLFITVIILFGINFDLGCNEKGQFHCNFKYTPADPEDIRRVIPISNNKNKTQVWQKVNIK